MHWASIADVFHRSDQKVSQSVQIFENIAESIRQMSSALAYLLTGQLQHNTNPPFVVNTKPQTKQAAVPPRPPLNDSRFTYSHTGDDAPQFTETGSTQFAKADDAPAESPAYTAKVYSPTSVFLGSVTTPSFESRSPHTKKPPRFTSEQFTVDSVRLKPSNQTPAHAVNTPSKNTTDNCNPYSDSDRSPPPTALEST